MFPPGTAIVRYHLRLIRPSWSYSGRRLSGKNQICKLVDGDWWWLAIGNVRVKKLYIALIFTSNFAVWETMWPWWTSGTERTTTRWKWKLKTNNLKLLRINIIQSGKKTSSMHYYNCDTELPPTLCSAAVVFWHELDHMITENSSTILHRRKH